MPKIGISNFLRLFTFSTPHSSAMQVLDAYTYGGVPQRRQRLWIVGVNENMAVSTLATQNSLIVPMVTIFYLPSHMGKSKDGSVGQSH